ncbi:unnamed protein product [Chironomus riparius]|uniref:ER membrane protein complex subunit 10 n=1 Tax=Chironomus riparius TaxID=315576 RepID=A0A9N9RIC6_9DIPT|nr:unnamed protein product [Chironomus riparius]
MSSIKFIWSLMASVFVLISSISSQSAFDSHLNVQLYHSLDANDVTGFTSRGNITIISINLGDIVVNQKELNSKERDVLKRLAKDKKLYRLKAEVVGSDGVKTTFLSSLKACHLIQSALHDFITINFDHNNAVLGVNIKAVSLDETSDDCDNLGLDNFNEFSTVVNLKNIEAAPIPDTQGFIQKLEREKEMRDKGEIDNRSFIQKYWMYIVPAVILLLVSGVTNTEGQGAAR